MRIAVNGARIYFDVDGAGLVPDGAVMRERPTVLLSHGGPGADHALYKPFMSFLTDQAQVIYLDHRGNGRSDEGAPDEWTLSQWADDIAGLLDALEIEKPMVLGSSFGGFVAQAFAVRYPERVAKLALVCTGPRSNVDLSVEMFAKLGGREVGEVARQWLSQADDPAIEAEFQRRCAPHYAVGDFDISAIGRSIDRPAVRRHFFRPGGEFHTMDFRAGLARIQCPTLVLHGDLDPILPLPLARELHAALPSGLSRLHVVENAGHIYSVDKPEVWRAEMRSFLFGS